MADTFRKARKKCKKSFGKPSETLRYFRRKIIFKGSRKVAENFGKKSLNFVYRARHFQSMLFRIPMKCPNPYEMILLVEFHHIILDSFFG